MIESLAKQRVNEFHLRHGGECYELDGYFWYSNGARRDVDLLGLLAEPPSLPAFPTPMKADRVEYDLACYKLNFFKAKLAVAERDFEALKEKLYWSPPADEDAAIAKLNELKEAVAARNRELRKAQAVVDATSIGRARKEAANRPAAQAAKVEGFRSKLAKIRV